MDDQEVLRKILGTQNLLHHYDEIMGREKTIVGEKRLVSLDLARIPITRIDAELAATWDKLEFIDLSHSNIMILPDVLSHIEITYLDTPLEGMGKEEIFVKAEDMDAYLEQLGMDIGGLQKPLFLEILEMREKHCTWCGNDTFRHEKIKMLGNWGLSVSMQDTLICEACNHVQHFKTSPERLNVLLIIVILILIISFLF